MDWLEYISSFNLVIIAISMAIGLTFGWVIWGGQKNYIRELEDRIEVTRSGTPGLISSSEHTSTSAPADESQIDGRALGENVEREKEERNLNIVQPPDNAKRAHHRDKTSSKNKADMKIEAGRADVNLRVTGECFDHQENQNTNQTTVGGDNTQNRLLEDEEDRLNRGMQSNNVHQAKNLNRAKNLGRARNLSRDSLEELSNELQKIRSLLTEQAYSQTDEVKEELDKTDHSIKVANGRVAMILQTLNKPQSGE